MYVPPNSEGLGTVAQEPTFNQVGKHLLISDQDRRLFAVKLLGSNAAPPGSPVAPNHLELAV
jgi:hypothetical protein